MLIPLYIILNIVYKTQLSILLRLTDSVIDLTMKNTISITLQLCPFADSREQVWEVANRKFLRL